MNLIFNQRNKKKRIIAVTIGGVGDAVLFSPVLKALKTINSNAQIEMLVANKLVDEIYKNIAEISCITQVSSRKWFSFLNAFFMIPACFNFMRKGGFEVGLFASGINYKLGAFLKYFGCVRNIKFAPKIPTFKTDLQCNVDLARRFNPNISENDTLVPLSKSSIFEAKNVVKKFGLYSKNGQLIAIYPSKELKHRPRWKLENLINIVKRLKFEGFKGKFVVVGSREEGKEWEQIDRGDVVDANLAGKLSILGSAALIKHCALIIGNDGGLMHLAGAVGCPSVVIMTNAPLSYRPPGRDTIVIHSKLDCCAGIYPKRPKNCKIAKCAEDIKIEDVFGACKKLLDKKQYE